MELWPAYWKDSALRVEFFGDEIDRISEINPVTGSITRRLTNIPVWPASHYVVSKEKMERALGEIERELDERERWLAENAPCRPPPAGRPSSSQNRPAPPGRRCS